MSFRVDAVEIMNRFTEYSPSRGETPLPLPIPGFWFKRICALADRVAKAENQNDDLNAQVAALDAALRAAKEGADFHPRAAKLMQKKKNFVVVAEDEPYFMDVYSHIRFTERMKLLWTDEDESLYQRALTAHSARS